MLRNDKHKELVKLMDTHKIYVIVEGGVVQEVLGIPPGVEVVVRDFDIDGPDADAFEAGVLRVCADDRYCTEGVWEHDADNQVPIPSREATEMDLDLD